MRRGREERPKTSKSPALCLPLTQPICKRRRVRLSDVRAVTNRVLRMYAAQSGLGSWKLPQSSAIALNVPRDLYETLGYGGTLKQMIRALVGKLGRVQYSRL